MALRKCPKCEVNYLRPNETVCSVCASSMKHKKPVQEDEVIMCSNCGEAPAVKGSDLCEDCLKEQRRQAERELMADKIRADEAEFPVEDDVSEDD